MPNDRSWLHVPGDDEDALGRAVAIGADVIVVDLADSVPTHAAKAARELTAHWLAVHRRQITGRPLGRWVRINALDTGVWREDVAAAMQGAPDGFILPRATGPEAVQALAAEIYEREQANQIPSGSTRIIPMVGGTPRSVLTLPAYVAASLPRLAGLCWDPVELAAAIGAQRTRDEAGRWTGTFGLLRGQLLLVAHARGIAAIDTFHADLADDDGLWTAARAMRADGFTGMLAIGAAQIPTIHAAFTPRGAPVDEQPVREDYAVIEEVAAAPPPPRQSKRMLDLDAMASGITRRQA